MGASCNGCLGGGDCAAGGEPVIAHTPGPWVAIEDPNRCLGDDWCIGLPDGKPDEVATCSKRDARLIAAAPELLAALERTLSWMTSYPGEACMRPRGPYEQARAAIAKATQP